MKVITIPIIKEWGEIPEYKTIFNVDDELATYIKALEKANNHIFANVNDDELLRSNAMNYKEAQEYKDRIDEAIEYVESLSSKGRDCDIYDDIKQEILRKLKGKE